MAADGPMRDCAGADDRRPRRAGAAAVRALLALVVIGWPGVGAAQPLWLVDFVYLAEGREMAEHDSFAANAGHLAGRHGVFRVLSLDRVPGLAYPGPIAPDRIDVWSVPDAAALEAWRSDPDRVWFEDLAGDFLAGQSSRYLARGGAIAPVAAGQLMLVDILQLPPSVEPGAAQAYFAAISDAGRPHGLERRAAWGTVEHLSGPFGRVDVLVLHAIPDHAALDRLLADPAFRNAEKARDDLFEFQGSTRQLYRANAISAQ